MALERLTIPLFAFSYLFRKNPLPWTKSKVIHQKYRWIVVDIYLAAR